MTLFIPFLEFPSMSKCSKFISSSGEHNYSHTGARTLSPKGEQGDMVLEQDAGMGH
jgi:hypothetical protein